MFFLSILYTFLLTQLDSPVYRQRTIASNVIMAFPIPFYFKASETLVSNKILSQEVHYRLYRVQESTENMCYKKDRAKYFRDVVYGVHKKGDIDSFLYNLQHNLEDKNLFKECWGDANYVFIIPNSDGGVIKVDKDSFSYFCFQARLLARDGHYFGQKNQQCDKLKERVFGSNFLPSYWESYVIP